MHCYQSLIKGLFLNCVLEINNTSSPISMSIKPKILHNKPKCNTNIMLKLKHKHHKASRNFTPITHKKTLKTKGLEGKIFILINLNVK